MASCSVSAMWWATPDWKLWIAAPPSCSSVTFSPVVAATTSGPVTNMCEFSRVMMMKSVRAGW